MQDDPSCNMILPVHCLLDYPPRLGRLTLPPPPPELPPELLPPPDEEEEELEEGV